MRERYVARAERSGRWWAIEVEGLSGAFSQARRIDQIEGMAREVIALMKNVKPDSFDVEVDVRLPSEWEGWAEEVRTARDTAASAERAASAAARKAARQLCAAGLPVRDVGAVLGVSPQRVSQLTSS